MKKKIFSLGILLILILSFTVHASDQWTTSVSKDEMEGTQTWYASSPIVEPTEKMDFPYSDIKAWLGIGYDGEDEWVYIGFNKTPNITNGKARDGYNSIYTRIKWDDNVENITLTQKWGSKFIHFLYGGKVVSKISESNTVLVELDWYGEGKVYFKFPLKGSSEAINKIHNAFDE